MDAADGGLLAIGLSDSDDAPPSPSKAGPTRADKLVQTEEAFGRVKASYRPKIQNGEMWKTVRLPLGPAASKPELLEAVHAVEELYFYRRYGEAAAFARRVLDGADGLARLDGDVRALLEGYEKRCLDRAKTTAAAS